MLGLRKKSIITRMRGYEIPYVSKGMKVDKEAK